MLDAQVRRTRSERLEIRLSPETRSLLNQAARLRHTTVTEFLVSSAVKAAEDAMLQPRLFEIETGNGWDALMRAVDWTRDDVPDPALVALLRDTAPDRG